MVIKTDFTGANIEVVRIDKQTVKVTPQIRDTTVDWFYWAFCVEGAQGQTWTFDFLGKNRVGYFGPAVSHDLKAWCWAGAQVLNGYSSFTYQFRQDDKRIYFAHNLLYHPEHFNNFLLENGISPNVLTVSENGHPITLVELGAGNKYIVLTARHHCCESTGSYVMEGILKELIREPIEGYCICAVPFMDIDGVFIGDQGKCRHPHDHNRDYIEQPIYRSTAALMEYTKNRSVKFLLDLHSPWHFGGRHNTCHIVHANEDMTSKYQCFGKILEEETAKDIHNIKHLAENDLGVNVEWNSDNAPTCAKYYSKISGIELSFTLETPYFGTQTNQVNQEKLVKLGENLASSIRQYINKYTFNQ